MGVMSVTDALKEFSVPTVVSYKPKSESDISVQVVQDIEAQSSFMKSI